MFQLTLRRRGISDQAVLRAMEEIPREAFVEPSDRDSAYRDSALGIACGQTISQPFVVAYMTEQLQLRKSHRVLEIGTGSGYQAAVLSQLAGQVLHGVAPQAIARGERVLRKDDRIHAPQGSPASRSVTAVVTGSSRLRRRSGLDP